MARGVVELIEDDSKIGEVLVICVTDGTKYKKFVDKVGLVVNSYLFKMSWHVANTEKSQLPSPAF